MKMTGAHYAYLEKAIAKVLAVHNPNGELVACYARGDFNNADKTKDLQRRFCFDVLFGTGLSSWVCANLYPYLNDETIYTALKAICPEVPQCET